MTEIIAEKLFGGVSTSPRTPPYGPSPARVVITGRTSKGFTTSFTNKCHLITTWKLSSSSTFLHVLRSIRKQHKIFYTIIFGVMVHMMDYFFGKKKSTKMFFHYDTMFADITRIVGKRMIVIFDKYITILINHYSSLPATIPFKGMAGLGDMTRSVYQSSVLVSSYIAFISLFFKGSGRKFLVSYYFATTTGTIRCNGFFHKLSPFTGDTTIGETGCQVQL